MKIITFFAIIFNFYCFSQCLAKQTWRYNYTQYYESEKIPFIEIVFFNDNECSLIIENDSTVYSSYFIKNNILTLSKISPNYTNIIKGNSDKFNLKYKTNRDNTIVYLICNDGKKRWKVKYDVIK